MKVRVERADLDEAEVIIRGDASSVEVKNILELLTSSLSARKMFFIKDGREYIFDAEDAAYFESCAGKTLARIGKEEFEVRSKLYELEAGLRARGFVRISKGVIVNVNRIASVEAEFSGNYAANMKNGQRLVISRKYVKDFRKYIMGAKLK